MKRFLIIGILFLLGLPAMAQSEVQFQNQESDKKIKVEIYPNPTTDYLNIQLVGETTKPTFHLHNIIGNEVKVEFEKMGDNKYRIHVEKLSPGYYLLAVKEPSSKFTKTLKFLKR